MSNVSRSYPSNPTKPTVTIVICTRNRPAELRFCLEGIGRMMSAPNEVIVLDNTEGDSDTKRAAEDFCARYLIEPKAGLSRARNRGLAESKTEIVAFLDDDAVPTECWLDALLAPFALAQVAVVTGLAIPPESLAGHTDIEPSFSLDKTGHRWFEAVAFGGLGIGANMAIRKAACDGLQLFDVRLGRGAPLHGWEEHFAFVRLLMRNHSAVHVPAALVTHTWVRRTSIDTEISQLFAYWLLLFFECPGHRVELLNFLFRRLMHKPVDWRRNVPALGFVLNSSWRVLMKAALVGSVRYFKVRKLTA